MRRHNIIVIILAAVLAAACGSKGAPSTPSPGPSQPAAAILTVHVDGPAGGAAWVRVGDREWTTRDDGSIVEEFRAGDVLDVTARAEGYVTSEPQQVRLVAGRMEPIRIALERIPPPPIPPVAELVVRGRQFYDYRTGELYVPRWHSGLTLLVKSAEQQEAFLTDLRERGYSGVRVFAGALTWAGQTPEGARAALPALLDRVAAHGMVIEITAVTDSATGYDAGEHIRLLAGLLTNRRGVVLELVNEIGHHTQASHITTDWARDIGRRFVAPLGIEWAIGATLETDEPLENGYPAAGGTYSTAHLDRGRPFWNQLRRVREVYAIVERHGAPAVNNEPIGCAEPGTPGQRYYDPSWAYTLGALDRAFGVGGVHHSQAGLHAELPGPVQRQCADAYVAGHRDVETAIGGNVVGAYLNVGHHGSPLRSARFAEGGHEHGVVRAYSFVSGDRGVTVLVGAFGDLGLEWSDGWRQVREVGSRTGQDGRRIVVLEIGR